MLPPPRQQQIVTQVMILIAKVSALKFSDKTRKNLPGPIWCGWVVVVGCEIITASCESGGSDGGGGKHNFKLGQMSLRESAFIFTNATTTMSTMRNNDNELRV